MLNARELIREYHGDSNNIRTLEVCEFEVMRLLK